MSKKLNINLTKSQTKELLEKGVVLVKRQGDWYQIYKVNNKYVIERDPSNYKMRIVDNVTFKMYKEKVE